MKGFRFLLLVLLLSACRNSGTPEWNWNLQSRSYARPLIDSANNKVFVVSQAGEVICGDLRTGKKQWTNQLDGAIVAEPAILEKRLMVATDNGWVAAFDTATGKNIWKTRVEDDGFFAPPSAAGTILIASSKQGNLYAFSASDGSKLWNYSGNVKYNSPAAFDGSNLYIGGWNRDFLNLTTQGKLRWRFHAAQVIVDEAIVKRNIVYFSAYDHYVYALDAGSGKLIWQHEADEPGRPFLIKEMILFAIKDHFDALNRNDGKFLRRFIVRETILQPYQYYDSLIFSVRSGKVFQLDPTRNTLNQLVQFRLPLFKTSIANGMLLGTDELHGIHAFRLPGQ